MSRGKPKNQYGCPQLGKVWSRNDYREVINQLMKYLTDFQPFGVIFMVNPNKSSIVDKYSQKTNRKDIWGVLRLESEIAR
jgi:hypothetical protein